MKKLTSTAAIIMALTGCSARHYAVCMAVGADSGCSHRLFTKATAVEVGALMATQPGSDERRVWIIDTRKHGKDVQRAPQPAEQQPAKKKPDSKI